MPMQNAATCETGEVEHREGWFGRSPRMAMLVSVARPPWCPRDVEPAVPIRRCGASRATDIDDRAEPSTSGNRLSYGPCHRRRSGRRHATAGGPHRYGSAISVPECRARPPVLEGGT